MHKVPDILKVLWSQCLTENWSNYVVSLCFQLNSLPWTTSHIGPCQHLKRQISDEYLKSISRLQVSGSLKELRDSECQWKFIWRRMVIDDNETTFKKERKKEKDHILFRTKEYAIKIEATYQCLYNYKSMTCHTVILCNGPLIF